MRPGPGTANRAAAMNRRCLPLRSDLATVAVDNERFNYGVKPILPMRVPHSMEVGIVSFTIQAC